MGKTLEEIEVAIAPLLQGWLQDPQDGEPHLACNPRKWQTAN